MTALAIGGIDWLVLDRRDGKTLVIAQNIIKRHPFHDTRFCAAWEESALCAHLPTGQFLLSVEEAARYFADDAVRIALWGDQSKQWWLRSMGIKNHAAYVGKDGGISTHGYRVDCPWCGVRPAMWIEEGDYL